MPQTVCSHFYKYGSQVQWLEGLLLRHELYVPTSAQLNDPRESHPRLKRVSPKEANEFLKRVLINKDPDAPPYDQQVKGLEAVVKDLGVDVVMGVITKYVFASYAEKRIYSMSKRWNNMSLWAAYGANHKGYCLEFVNDGLFNLSRDVIYTDTLEYDLNDETHQTIDWAIYKSTEWRNEEEVRFSLPGDMVAQPMRIAPDLLSRVILGKDMPAADKKRICQWAVRRKPRLNIVRAVYDAYLQQLTLQDVRTSR